MKPFISIADALTGSIEVREMTDEEFAVYQEDSARREAKIAKRLEELDAKQLQREQVLERLGITEEEAKLLLS
jgi:hypothetical protein